MYTRTNKAVNGEAKRGDNERANGGEKGDVRQAKHRNVRQAKREDKNKSIERNKLRVDGSISLGYGR